MLRNRHNRPPLLTFWTRPCGHHEWEAPGCPRGSVGLRPVALRSSASQSCPGWCPSAVTSLLPCPLLSGWRHHAVGLLAWLPATEHFTCAPSSYPPDHLFPGRKAALTAFCRGLSSAPSSERTCVRSCGCYRNAIMRSRVGRHCLLCRALIWGSQRGLCEEVS